MRVPDVSGKARDLSSQDIRKACPQLRVAAAVDESAAFLMPPSRVRSCQKRRLLLCRLCVCASPMPAHVCQPYACAAVWPPSRRAGRWMRCHIGLCAHTCVIWRCTPAAQGGFQTLQSAAGIIASSKSHQMTIITNHMKTKKVQNAVLRRLRTCKVPCGAGDSFSAAAIAGHSPSPLKATTIASNRCSSSCATMPLL